MQLAVKAVSKGSTETFGSFQNFSSIVVYGVFFTKLGGLVATNLVQKEAYYLYLCTGLCF
jgi:hypothetical protein